jgi:hypothetical protein
MPGSYISDAQGEPWPFYAKGGDPADPGRIEVVFLEIFPGGRLVAKRMPSQRVTVAPDPRVPPTLAEVEGDRHERIRESEERERKAIEQERDGDFAPSAEQPSDADEATGEDDTAEPDESEQERSEREAREATARRASTSGGGTARKKSASRS